MNSQYNAVFAELSRLWLYLDDESRRLILLVVWRMTCYDVSSELAEAIYQDRLKKGG